VICEIMNDDGTMARVPDLIHFCERHRLLMITVAELERYRLDSEYEELLIATPDVFPMTVGKFPIELGSLL
jgi:3,4-dihydroxy 2-butanone 4-phosphate synthase / GTP cyclohydrolase II